MKQYGPSFISYSYSFKANKVSHIARHVAIKNKVLKLSQVSLISKERAYNFQVEMEESNGLTGSCTAIDIATL